jgi:hypothetical protein
VASIGEVLVETSINMGVKKSKIVDDIEYFDRNIIFSFVGDGMNGGPLSALIRLIQNPEPNHEIILTVNKVINNTIANSDKL